MPNRTNGEVLPDKDSRPEHFQMILKATLVIYQGEQQRINKGGHEEIPDLVQQLAGYAYNEAPYSRLGFDPSTTTPLQWWQTLAKDSNANKLAVSNIDLFC